MDTLSNDSAPEERTFTAAKTTKKIASKPVFRSQKTKKIVKKLVPELQKAIESKLPVRMIPAGLGAFESGPKTTVVKAKGALQKRTAVMKNKKIRLVFEDKRRKIVRTNPERLSQFRKYFFEDKKRVPLSEIL